MTGSKPAPGRVALDTNYAVHVLNDVPAVVAWLNTFGELCLPLVVVGELQFGALNSHKATENLARVDKLIARCRALPVDLGTAESYAQVRLGLKRKGRPIPGNDVWIAAACLQHALPLATADGHFASVDGLQVLAAP